MKLWVAVSGWLALLFGLAGLFVYIVVPGLLILIGLLAGLCLICALFFIFAERDAIRRGIKTRTALYGMNTAILVVVVLGILVFLNLISHRHKHRFDHTSSGFYTLAPQTQKIVATLPRNVTMTAFFQNESAQKAEFKNLMDGYLELTDKVKLNFVDPDKNPAVTKQYGVTTYGTVVLESGKQETKVQSPTEENVSNAILKVIKDEKKKIYFLEGHGEQDPDNTEAQGYSTAKQALERDGFIVEKLLLLQAGKIPSDAQALVIAGPEKPILAEEQNALEDYLNRGGAVFLLLDPQSQSGLEPFLSQWGVEVKEDIVIDPMSKLFGGDYAAPVVNQYVVHDITKDFGLPTIFPVVRSVSVGPMMEGIEVNELLQTGENSWAETSFDSKQVKFDEGADRKGPVPIAVIATKIIASGDKKDESQENAEAENASEKKPQEKKTNLLVLGDSDFANNNYFNFSGNGDFFLNTTSWLAEEESLISIRPRERKDTPIQLTRAWGSAIFILGTILFPGIVVLTGIRTWWRRRRL